MQPTPTPAPVPGPAPAPTDPVVELVRAQRLNVGYGLTVLAFLFLVATVALAMKSSRLPASTTTTTEKDKGKDDALRATKGEVADLTQPNRFDYVVGAFGTALALLIVGGGGAYLLVALPRPTEAEQRREARVLILSVGGLVGVSLILIGVLYFWRWEESLVKWLDKSETKEAKYVLYPLLMIVAGGGLMFLAIQPARAEERGSAVIRRLVYGSNFGLTVLILFVVLVITNAVVAMRLPNKLDTTNSGFYTLNPQTKQFVETLEQPVHAYAIFQESTPAVEDTKRLLSLAQDANPGKFRVTFLSPALNRAEVAKLRTEYGKSADMTRDGVLLVAGDESNEDRRRPSFIRADEFSNQTEDEQGRLTHVFNGEPRLLRELMFVADDKVKPKVYFTQSSGELSLTGARGTDRRRSATALKQHLEKNNYEVFPLTFDAAGPAKVPEDAAVVVVADPTAPLTPAAVAAVTEFMSKPRPDGKKGKLVVFASGIGRGADDKPLKTGLEPLLGTFGVQLSDRFTFATTSERAPQSDPDEGTRTFTVVVNPESIQERNPVAISFGRAQFTMFDVRELVQSPPPPGGGGFRVVPLLATKPGEPTWSEPLYTATPAKTWNDLNKQVEAIMAGPGAREDKVKRARELVAPKQINGEPHDVALFVSETPAARDATPSARAVVFGTSEFVSDSAAGRLVRGQTTTIGLDLTVSTMRWLRDRPTVIGVQEKPYTTYTLKAGTDNTRLTIVPVALALLGVLGLGAGVWAIRRK